MSGIDKQELARKAQIRLDKYIIGADQKASILITAQFTLAGLIANVVRVVWQSLQLSTKAIVSAGFLVALSSAVCSGLVIYPRSNNPKAGHLYWKDILSRQQDEYISDSKSLSDDEAYEEFLSENYDLSEIAIKKHFWFRISIILTGVMIVLFVVGLASYLLCG